MTRTSTQDGLAAAAVVGISIVLVRQLLNSIDEEEKEICKANHNLNNNNNTNRRKYTWMPWWWPIIAIQRWKNKQQSNNSTDTEQYEHRGACNCGSIQFIVRGARQLNNQGKSSNNAINSSPSKIRFRCIPISATNFQIVCGENEMRFYYENDDSDNNNHVSNQAQVFCSNCGVTVFHANRKTGNLEINVDCLDDKEEPKFIQRRDVREQSSSGLPSMTNPSERHHQQQQYPRSQSSLSSTALEKDNNNEQVVNKHSIGTLLEDEPFLEGFANLSVAMLGESSSPTNQQPVGKESVSSSDAPTQPESYSIAESDIDDLSMGSSSLTGALPLYHSALSVASSAGGRVPSIKTTGLPPLPPASNRISPSDGSIKTLPLWLGSDRPGGGRRVRNRSFDMNGGGGWSVSSELNDDLDSEGKAIISPTMRDQMKKYLERHENSKQYHY